LSQPIIIGEEYDLEEYDETPILFYAIRSGASLEAIEILLEHGVDINQVDDDGLSAVDIAIKSKREDVVQLCIAKGVDINQTHRKRGLNPLILASCFNNVSMVELLLKNGADINSKDSMGMSAKDYARKLGQKKVLDFLESRGAKHNLYKEEVKVEQEEFNMKNRQKPTEDMGFDSI
jgi:ankyrin repeat protein